LFSEAADEPAYETHPQNFLSASSFLALASLLRAHVVPTEGTGRLIPVSDAFLVESVIAQECHVEVISILLLRCIYREGFDGASSFDGFEADRAVYHFFCLMVEDHFWTLVIQLVSEDSRGVQQVDFADLFLDWVELLHVHQIEEVGDRLRGVKLYSDQVLVGIRTPQDLDVLDKFFLRIITLLD